MENTQEQRNIIYFEEGLLGFEDIHEYLLFHEDEENVLWSLTAADSDVPSFIVMDPFSICQDYSPTLSKRDLETLGNPELTDLCFLAIAVIRTPLSNSVVNLKAPIVINIHTQQAKQVILEDTAYPLRYPMFADR